MPLSEFYRMAKGKVDDSQSKTTGVSYMPDNEFAELVWEDGQVMMQGQSKDKKSPVCSNFQFLTPRVRDRDIGISTATTSRLGKYGAMQSSFNMPISVPSVEMGLNQDDDLVPWLDYPIEDPLEHDYCSNLLPKISGVTVNDPSNHHNISLMDKRGSSNLTVRDSQNVSVPYGSIVDQGNSSKVSSSRVSHVFPWTSHQSPTMAPSLISGVSDIVSANTRNNPQVIFGDSRQSQASSGGVSQLKMQKQDSGQPCRSSNLLNFSHFSRPITMARADNQNGGLLGNCGTSGTERMGNNDKKSIPNDNVPAELEFNAPNCGLQKEMGLLIQSNLVPANVNSKPLVTKQLKESHSGGQSDTGRRKDAIHNDKPPNLALGSITAKRLPDNIKHMEPILAASSVCSGNSAERASNDPSNSLKRKHCDTEDFECQSEDADEESVGVKKAASCLGGTGSKRSRAAEVHNLSERRRRDRINEKMRALQELIPNCNKVDKASMLDEAIEYLKTLQLQVQIMSMGAGLCMPPMMFTAGMQHMHAAYLRHYSHMGVGMGMGIGMGMGYGMGMVDMNGGYQGRPVIPMQGQRYLSPHIPPPSSFHGIPPGPNLQIHGHHGQSVPISFPQGSPVPISGRSPLNPTAAGLNASRAGPHVEVVNVCSTLNSKDLTQNASTQPMHNGDDTNNSMKQPSSQFQAKNEGFDQSAFAGKSDQAAADEGGSTAVLTNSNDSTPSR